MLASAIVKKDKSIGLKPNLNLFWLKFTSVITENLVDQYHLQATCNKILNFYADSIAMSIAF
jgi:hypothetical protein